MFYVWHDKVPDFKVCAILNRKATLLFQIRLPPNSATICMIKPAYHAYRSSQS